MKVNWHFGGTYHLHLQVKEWAKQETSMKQAASSMQTPTCCLLDAGFVFGLLFYPEDRGNMFLQKTGRLSPDYTARQNSSQPPTVRTSNPNYI
jgi:hypothetical protein